MEYIIPKWHSANLFSLSHYCRCTYFNMSRWFSSRSHRIQINKSILLSQNDRILPSIHCPLVLDSEPLVEWLQSLGYLISILEEEMLSFQWQKGANRNDVWDTYVAWVTNHSNMVEMTRSGSQGRCYEGILQSLEILWQSHCWWSNCLDFCLPCFIRIRLGYFRFICCLRALGLPGYRGGSGLDGGIDEIYLNKNITNCILTRFWCYYKVGEILMELIVLMFD